MNIVPVSPKPLVLTKVCDLAYKVSTACSVEQDVLRFQVKMKYMPVVHVAETIA